MALFAETSKSILLATGRAMETRCAEQKAEKCRRAQLLTRRLSVRVLFGEPIPFSPNPASPVVDGIGLPAPTTASQDIPNSAIHFRTILFSPSGPGESLWLAR